MDAKYRYDADKARRKAEEDMQALREHAMDAILSGFAAFSEGKAHLFVEATPTGFEVSFKRHGK